EILRSLAGPPSPPGLAPPGWRVPVDCVRANELCAGEPSCSSRYRTLRQCLAGRDRNTMLANKECQVALEVLQESPLYDCRCKRGMKKELQCLQIYWSIHLGLTEGMDPAATSKSNHCLDAAKACNLNDNCKRLRSAYISTCSRELSATEPCSRRKCHKALRQFFDRVPGEFTFRLLFCSCRDPACAERRRQTIVPSCSYEDKDKPNCLDLRGTCRADHLCRSRLADFHTNCQATFQSLTSCPGDNFQACLGSYAGLIGFDITPNYVDASTTSITISPWCSCKGSGNMEEECEKFLRDFTENPCLRKALPHPALLLSRSFIIPILPKPLPLPGNAIQAFGNGTDVNLAPKNPNPAVTAPPKVEKSPALPDDVNDSNTAYDTSVISTCTSLQEQGLKPNKSKAQSLCYSEAQLTTDVMPDQKTFMDPKAGSSRHRESRILLLIPVLIPALGL
ncbi:GDNF family receptor alpha-2, partial [Lamprotornis superbus]